jgi:geranylgeranyl reductase
MYDVAVVGAGPAGAVAAEKLARAGRKVAPLDRAARVKPCGGAIPPRLIRDFNIPDGQIAARINAARMVSPQARHADIEIEGGFVGMVDREHFDPFLIARAEAAGAERIFGAFLELERDAEGRPGIVCRPREKGAARQILRCKPVIGADGARSDVGRAEAPGGDAIPYVIAYHEIIRPPEGAAWDAARCDVIHDGRISPDFYGRVFPHGETGGVGMGAGIKGVDLKAATASIHETAGLAGCETIRREGAPIPLQPLKRWDNGRDVLLAGDAAGVVAPASGEGIPCAMVGGERAAEAVETVPVTGTAFALKHARKSFMREHGAAFKVLSVMQNAYCRSDERRERFERFKTLCADLDVQKPTFDSYMNWTLSRARPLAQLKIFVKNIAHLTRLVPAS